MRSVLTKTLQIEFKGAFASRFKIFEEARLSSAPPGSRAWNVIKTARGSGYIILIISPRDDRFTIEIARSESGVIPEATADGPSNCELKSECRFRISRIWQEFGFETWYNLQKEDDTDAESSPLYPAGECLQRIPGKVVLAIEAIERFGIPYLERHLLEKSD
jgi:hypothetical protein